MQHGGDLTVNYHGTVVRYATSLTKSGDSDQKGRELTRSLTEELSNMSLNLTDASLDTSSVFESSPSKSKETPPIASKRLGKRKTPRSSKQQTTPRRSTTQVVIPLLNQEINR